ncbi:hypothetical protein [Oscillibacter ruminantium]|uniref:hypothetical protein n=1 Tax=Oscillibacter ruminantium TaxID=1263547 RepID=UPI00331D886A
MYPFNPFKGQTIQTNAPGVVADIGYIANLTWAAAETVAADTDGIFKGIVASASAVVTAKPDSDKFVAQPPCARNLTVTVAATTAAHVKAAEIVVTGKNIAGETITENFTPTDDAPATLTGTKAFASVDSVSIPKQDGASVTVDVGFGELIGLPYKLAKKRVLLTLNDGVVDTAPTLAISASALESNTVDFNGSLDGSVMDMSIIV